MKSYEEMSDAVMKKVRIRKAAQKRRNGFMICTASMCCLALSVIMLYSKQISGKPALQVHAPTDTSIPELPSTSAPEPTNTEDVLQEIPQMILLSAVSAEEEEVILKENVCVPSMAQIRVRNVAGMSAEERQRILAEENTYINKILGDDPDDSAYGRYCRDNVIITMLSAGKLSIAFNDLEKVARIQITRTENGYIFFPRISGIKYTDWNENALTVEVEGEKLRRGLAMLETDKFAMLWQFAPSVADRINDDPDMDITELSDRITITVTYTDGTKETQNILFQVRDDGQMNIILLSGTSENM